MWATEIADARATSVDLKKYIVCDFGKPKSEIF